MPMNNRRARKRLIRAGIINVVSLTLLTCPKILLVCSALFSALMLGCDGPHMPEEQLREAFDAWVRLSISLLSVVGVILASITSVTIIRTIANTKRRQTSRRRIRIQSGDEIKKIVPPFGEYLLYLFLTRQERITLIGDLTEEFVGVYLKFGETKSRIWYYKQVFTSLWPLIKRFIFRWGFLGIVWRVFKRFAP